MIEQQELTNRLDDNGFQMGDEVRIAPVNARRKSFKINRTNFYFISRHFESEMLQGCFALLPEMRSERFKVKLSIKDVLSVNSSKKKRFYLEVQEGCAFKLNGSFHMGSFIEKGDILEIGYNQIFFDSGVKEENSKDLIDDRLIQSNLPLLLQGETGVGKSSMAKSIHKLSNRCGKFVQVNLSAISKNLIESELFGHVKGSFTGAHTDKCGVLKQADHGTLFLDEIDSLPLEIQTKLLLFLDNQIITPVGSTSSIPLNVRLIFASGRKLIDVVKNKEMRQDFFYRLNAGASFHIKSLRDDTARIESFCEEYALEKHIKISKRLIDFYKTLPWPGNYRQLQGHLETKRVMSKRGFLDFDEMDEVLIEQSSELESFENTEVKPTLHQVKIAYMKKIYFEMDKNISRSAAVLGISSRSLRNSIKSFDSFYEPIT